MRHSTRDLAFEARRPWPEARLLGAKHAPKQRRVRAIRFWLDQHRRLRDGALFVVAIDSKLRGRDEVKVRGNVVSGSRVRNRTAVIRQEPSDQFNKNRSIRPGTRCGHG